MKNFVSKEWLLLNLSNEDLIILDTRAELNDPDAGFKQYKEGHIKGAQYVSLDNIMTGEISIHGGRHPLPDRSTFICDMKKLGMTDNSTVVIYDNGDLAMGGRLWWMLKYAGKDKVYVLEGGYGGWTNANYETTADVIVPIPSNDLSLNINNSIIVDIKDIKEAIDSKDTIIIDSRAYERYSGQTEPLDRIAGHIPSAINYPWMNLVKDGLKNKEYLKEYYKDLNEYENVIVYCGSGVTATVNILFMEEIGLKPKLYAGGYSDWVSYEENEVRRDNC